MAMTIGPAVCPARRLRLGAQAMFFVGTFLGALVTYGLLRGLFITELHEGRIVLLVAILVVGVCGSLRDLGKRAPVPYVNKQVPEWLRGIVPLPVTSVIYGFLLGLGFVTKFTYGAHLTLVLVLATTEPPRAAFAGLLLYAIARTVATSIGRTEQSPGTLALTFQRQSAYQRYVRMASIALTVGLTATAVALVA